MASEGEAGCFIPRHPLGPARSNSGLQVPLHSVLSQIGGHWRLTVRSLAATAAPGGGAARGPQRAGARPRSGRRACHGTGGPSSGEFAELRRPERRQRLLPIAARLRRLSMDTAPPARGRSRVLFAAAAAGPLLRRQASSAMAEKRRPPPPTMSEPTQTSRLRVSAATAPSAMATWKKATPSAKRW